MTHETPRATRASSPHARPRRLFAASLALASLLALLGAGTWLVTSPARAQSDTVVRFTSPLEVIELDETVELTVEVFDVTDLAGFQISFRWDPEILEYVEATVIEDFLGSTGRRVDYLPPVVSEDGVVVLAFTVPQGGPAPGATGSGELMTLRLRGLGGGSSALEMVEVLLTDTLNNEIQTDVEGAQVVVNEPEPDTFFTYLPLALNGAEPGG